jgi:hypothetical protein
MSHPSRHGFFIPRPFFSLDRVTNKCYVADTSIIVIEEKVSSAIIDIVPECVLTLCVVFHDSNGVCPVTQQASRGELLVYQADALVLVESSERVCVKLEQVHVKYTIAYPVCRFREGFEVGNIRVAYGIVGGFAFVVRIFVGELSNHVTMYPLADIGAVAGLTNPEAQ